MKTWRQFTIDWKQITHAQVCRMAKLKNLHLRVKAASWMCIHLTRTYSSITITIGITIAITNNNKSRNLQLIKTLELTILVKPYQSLSIQACSNPNSQQSINDTAFDPNSFLIVSFIIITLFHNTYFGKLEGMYRKKPSKEILFSNLGNE